MRAGRFIISLLFLFSVSIGLAEPIQNPTDSLPAFDIELRNQLNVHNTSVEALVGDEVPMRIVGLENNKVNLSIPEPTDKEKDDEMSRGWEIDPEGQGKHDQAPSTEYWFSLNVLKPGKVILPSLTIVNESGKAIGRTNPFTIDVSSAIKPTDPNPNEMANFQPPVSLPFPWWVIALFLVFALLAVAGIIYFLIRLSRRRRELGPFVAPAEPPKPEDEEALLALADLERQALMSKGGYKNHYFRVSEILKGYFGRRYGFDALESTTRELIEALEEKGHVSDTMLDKVESLFAHLDQVKFTDIVPEPDQGAKALTDARQVVLTTRKPMVSPVPLEKETALAP